MKRRFSLTMEVANKRQKTAQRSSLWIPASRFANYFRQDPILDYFDKLRIYDLDALKQFLGLSERDGVRRFRPKPKPSGMFQLLADNGNRFEERVLPLIKSRFPNHYQFPTGWKEIQSESNALHSKQVINMSEMDVLIHPVLRSYEHSIYGAPDLVMKGSALKTLVENPPDVEDNVYYTVDIKNSNLSLSVDTGLLLNSSLYDGYRGQLYAYLLALNEIQDRNDTKVFILGKNTTRGSQKYPFLHSLGEIDFSKEAWVDQTFTIARRWHDTLDKHGEEWSLSPPSVPELYPNMNNSFDGVYRPLKQFLANKLGEITNLWNCSTTERQFAHIENVFSYRDEKCTPEVMGISTESAKYLSVKRFLEANRESAPSITLDDENNVENWRDKRESVYIDVETAYDSTETQRLFLIGKYHEGKYKAFTATSLTPEEEQRIAREFLASLPKNKVRLVHWGNIERHILTPLFQNADVEWLNLYSVFSDSAHPIVVKGQTNWSIKDVSKAMFDTGMIDEYYDGGISNGGDCLARATDCYSSSPPDKDILDEIITYNKKDCRVLSKILAHLHTL